MPTVYDHTCVSTTVRNVSGARRTFSFLPPHGRTLENNGEATFLGTISEAISRTTRNAKRKLDAFMNALDNGNLDIVHTPAPILEDTVTGANKVLQITSGTLGSADPCWETSLSEE